MLQNELKILQELHQQLAVKNFTVTAERTVFFGQSLTLIETETKRIKDAFMTAIFTVADESIIERYVQLHQTTIIDLANQVNQTLSGLFTGHDDLPGAGQTEQVKLLRSFLVSQFDLLNYIEKFLSKYFNLDAVIPEPYRVFAAEELQPGLESLENLVEQNVQAKQLKNCLLAYLQKFGAKDFPQELTFRGLIYLKEFIKETTGVLNNSSSDDKETDLFVKLFYLNFNHLAFFSYCQVKINQEVAAADESEHQLIILSRALSLIKGIQGKPGYSYHTVWPSIKDMVQTWLHDEIALARLSFKNNSLPDVPSGPQPFKLAINLSVAHIACLLKLFYDESVLPATSITDLFKFVVLHFRSKRQEKISTGSLSKEYYSVEQKTAAQILDLLERMISRLKKHYFPVLAAICLTCYC